jgi:hypothetical protein
MGSYLADFYRIRAHGLLFGTNIISDDDLRIHIFSL